MINVFKKTRQSLERTREAWQGRINKVFNRTNFDDSFWEELEEMLIAADAGVSSSTKLVEIVRNRAKEENLQDAAAVKKVLSKEMVNILKSTSKVDFPTQSQQLSVILVIGVNGTGKTTSIAKLSHKLKKDGNKVILAAADTFRAAAIDQLKYWGTKLEIDVIAGQPGSDPGAVVFDAMEAAKKRQVDILIIDTAGRIQTKSNLMEELKKINRIIGRSGIEPQVLLVLDANTGQNGLSQAKYFADAVDVRGIVLAKLDSTSKGGIVLAVADELGIPILFVGTGQELDDLTPFEAEGFVEALF